jgi:hypothetical protein
MEQLNSLEVLLDDRDVDEASDDNDDTRICQCARAL